MRCLGHESSHLQTGRSFLVDARAVLQHVASLVVAASAGSEVCLAVKTVFVSAVLDRACLDIDSGTGCNVGRQDAGGGVEEVACCFVTLETSLHIRVAVQTVAGCAWLYRVGGDVCTLARVEEIEYIYAGGGGCSEENWFAVSQSHDSWFVDTSLPMPGSHI